MENIPHTLPASQRLKSKSLIDRLFEEGSGGVVYPVRYMVLSSPAEGDAADAAVMVSVPKRRHKRANVRNLLKRRMREAYRLHKEPLRIRCTEQGESVSLGLMYISQDVLDYSQIENAVRKIISRLSQRS